MIVEVHGRGFWTRVRFPPGPFFKISDKYRLVNSWDTLKYEEKYRKAD